MENKKTFQDLIQSEQPVLVDFFATWCGPCKAMNPVLKQVAHEMSGKAKIIKVDIDKNRATAMQFGVQAVPTFMLFKKGQVVWSHMGGTSAGKLKLAIENNQ